MFSWAEDDEAAFESSKEWKGTIMDEHYIEPVYDPAEIQRNGEQRGRDPDVRRARAAGAARR
jgi:hypothetical protein